MYPIFNVHNFIDKTLLLVIAAALKLLLTQGIYVFYLYISEVLPTPIRSAGMGSIIVPGTILMTFSPYIVKVRTIICLEKY